MSSFRNSTNRFSIGLALAVILAMMVSTTQAQSEEPYTITKISGDSQVLDLQAGFFGEGGSAPMVPQVVQVTDSSGNPVAGVDVTFHVPNSHPIYATMIPYGDVSVTRTTDSNGMADASNNAPYYEGQGFEVYSVQVDVTRTLQMSASVPGATPVLFQVTANSVQVPSQPLTITKIAGDSQTINLDDTSRYAGGEAETSPITIEVRDADDNPVAGVWFFVQGAVNNGTDFNISIYGSLSTRMVTGSDGRATFCCATISAQRINTTGSYTFTLTPQGGWPTDTVIFNGDLISWSPPPPSTPGTLYPVSPSLQQLQLLPSPYFSGGEAFMVPQQVIAKDANGNPIPGVTVSFEVANSYPVYSSMNPFGATVITQVTDADGIATASNPYQYYEGPGFQVYAYDTGQIRTLQLHASVIDWNTVTFDVQTATIGATLTDTTPPNITVSAQKSGGGDYPAGQWTSQNVIIQYSATDALSSIQSVTPDQTFSNEGANQSATGTATDSAGYSANVTFTPINIDKTNPTITPSARTALGAQYAAGQWTNQSVVVRFDAQDGLSGVASLSPEETISNEGANQSASGSAMDYADNRSSATFSPINIDKTNPVTEVSLTAANGQPFTPGMKTTAVTIDLMPTDALSGVIFTRYTVDDGSPQSGTSFQVSGAGSYDVQYWSTDAAGNEEARHSLNIVVTGNDAPVAMDDLYDAFEDTSLVIPFESIEGVLANDTDENGDDLTAVLDNDVTNGTLAMADDGSFTYDPDDDYCGGDSFSYHANDGTDDSEIATVSITVACVNDVPSFTKGADETVLEDSGTAGLHSVNGWATAISAGPANESDQTLSFNVSNNNNDLFSVQPAISASGDLTYTLAADANGTAVVTVAIMDDGGTENGGDDTSDDQTFNITVDPVNDTPSFTARDANSDEDAGAKSDVVVGDSFSAGPANESTQTLAACVVTDPDVPTGLLAAGPIVTIGGAGSDECHLAYTSAPDAFGSFTFKLAVQDSGKEENGGDDTSDAQLVTITINPVNDPPVITSISDGTGTLDAQSVDYSDSIETVTITAYDIDSPASIADLILTASPLPSAIPTPDFASTADCSDAATSITGTRQDCTWTMDGTVLDPEMVYDVVFAANDGNALNNTNICADSPNVCDYVLTVQAEDAYVELDESNPIDVQVPADDGPSGTFSLFFSAWEVNNPDFANDGDAKSGDLTEMVPDMTLVPVGPGGPEDAITCDWDDELPGGPDEPKPDPEDGYNQVAYFQCDFDAVPVNTYEILAAVGGGYYTGLDEGVLVVYDPSLGYTTGGGFFYWPETEITDTGHDCYPYAGDKTNFGFNFKYNKKRTNIQGNLLMMRHSIDPISCAEGNWKVKSNQLDGMSLGTETDADGNYGWSAVSGKATFRDPTEYNTGGNAFLFYVEDHDGLGCNQEPADRIWIQVDAENIWIDPLGMDPAADDSADDSDAVPIECGNIVVPHTTGKGGGGDGPKDPNPKKPPKG